MTAPDLTALAVDAMPVVAAEPATITALAMLITDELGVDVHWQNTHMPTHAYIIMHRTGTEHNNNMMPSHGNPLMGLTTYLPSYRNSRQRDTYVGGSRGGEGGGTC